MSFEDAGQIIGIPATGMGTYTSVIRPDGSILGQGQGLSITQDGEAITWTGAGIGKFGPGGAVSYRGMLFLQTASQKLARINNLSAAFEYDVDPAGNSISKLWEWK